MRLKYALIPSLIALLPLVTLRAAEAPASAVADAAMNGDAAAVRSLIQHRADVNAPQADGATALHWAAYRNDLDIAAALIAAGANVKAANREGATPLSMAAENGSTRMIEMLLKAGASPNERRQPHGETPLMFAARNGNTDAIKVLLDHGADVNATEDLRGTTPLMWAADQAHPAAVKLLVERGADIGAATKPDTLRGTAYLAPSFQARAQQVKLQVQGKFFERYERQQNGTGNKEKVAPAGRTASKAEAEDVVAAADADAAASVFGLQQNTKGGGLTPLVFAARQGDLDSVKILVEAGANVNQRTRYGWTALLTATQNRHYKIGAYLLEHGADPNLANDGGWTPLYLATDNRNIEGGDYPVRQADMDHLEFIKRLIEHGANVNARVCGSQSTPEQCKGDSTETRTIFTMQWLYEDGATPFLRAAQSGDVELMKLLLEHGADPKITTSHGQTALSVASGIGWVEGVTFEHSPEQTLEAVKLCLELGIDVNAADDEGRTALHGAAHKGRTDVISVLVARGAKLDAHDKGSRDTLNGAMQGHTWVPIDYARGLVRVGVQSAIPHPEAEELLAKLMKERGMEVPKPMNLTICLTSLCDGSKQ